MAEPATWEIFLAIDEDDDFGFDTTAEGAVYNYRDEFAEFDNAHPTRLIRLMLTRQEDDTFKAEAEILPVPEMAEEDE